MKRCLYFPSDDYNVREATFTTSNLVIKNVITWYVVAKGANGLSKTSATKTLSKEYHSMNDQDKSENMMRIVSAFSSRPDESLDNKWPADNAKFALMTISIEGLDKSLARLGNDPSVYMETDNLIKFYQTNIKNLYNDSSAESKQLFAECEKAARALPESEDTKHAIVLKALDDAHASANDAAADDGMDR